MKAIVLHEYGGPEELKFGEYPDPTPGPGEVLVRVAATSVNPIAQCPPVDAIADTVGGRVADKLMAKIKPEGVFASVVGAPRNAAHWPSVKVVPVFSKFDRQTLQFMAEAVRDGKLVIPVSRTLPLSKAAEAHAAAEKGGIGKIVLLV